MGRKEALSSVIQHAERAGWSGADPYDGLHSAVGGLAIPFGPPARLLVIQSALRFPWARPLLGPTNSINPKGLGLFLGAVTQARSLLGDAEARRLSRQLIQHLESSARKTLGGLAWGYPFPWQSRFFYAPAGTPNAVVTSTVGWHLLQASEAFGDLAARRLAEAAGRFLLDGLHWSRATVGGEAISYTPRDRTQIVNVSGLAARLLARLGHGKRAESLIAFVLASQLENGCWPYSPNRKGRWEDSFHTGFVLESLLQLRRQDFEIPLQILRRGFVAYRRFFDPDGGARLYATSRSVYDAHSAAQGIVTFVAAAEEGGPPVTDEPAKMADRIADWSMRALWLPQSARFAYRVRNGSRDERDFTRWVQAWMALGLARVEAMSATRPSEREEARGMGVEVG